MPLSDQIGGIFAGSFCWTVLQTLAIIGHLVERDWLAFGTATLALTFIPGIMLAQTHILAAGWMFLPAIGCVGLLAICLRRGYNLSPFG